MTWLNDLVVRRILAELDRQGVTIGQLARSTGIRVSVLNRKLTGIDRLNVDDIDSIAGVLGVPTAAFVPNEERHQ
ncbi:helix-turn-helix domain-containing protein [Cryobacterium cryoconiti]|uniref:helix-turn-helix domain-containing protein n=1 Tax=Cryobacterium cryoconiti TaxID=1259239 RepID=UPI00141B8DEE|nr:helix-turn-helix transcriptional regulator [Cryobacterium cryoconiti]